MEFLIGMLVLAVVGFFVLMALGGVAAVGMAAAEGSGRAKAESSKGDTIDRLFGDDADDVLTYDTRPYNALKPSSVIPGAALRGYKLLHDDGGVLTFQRS